MSLAWPLAARPRWRSLLSRPSRYAERARLIEHSSALRAAARESLDGFVRACAQGLEPPRSVFVTPPTPVLTPPTTEPGSGTVAPAATAGTAKAAATATSAPRQ